MVLLFSFVVVIFSKQICWIQVEESAFVIRSDDLKGFNQNGFNTIFTFFFISNPKFA